LLVGDAEEAYKVSTANGAKGVLEPLTMRDEENGQQLVISEVGLYGDVVLR
jgi:4-hydroxyphenylpyruvate dioxygenase